MMVCRCSKGGAINATPSKKLAEFWRVLHSHLACLLQPLTSANFIPFRRQFANAVSITYNFNTMGAWTLTSRVLCSSALVYGFTRTSTFKKSILNQHPHFKLTSRQASSTAIFGSVMALVAVFRKPLGLAEVRMESNEARMAREATATKPRKVKKTRDRASIL